jgi:hypothetical protein
MDAKLGYSDRAAVFLAPWIGGSRLISLWDMKEFFGHALFGYGRYVQELGTLFGLRRTDTILTEDQCQNLTTLIRKVDKGVEYLALPASKQACEELLSILAKKHPSMLTLEPLLVELNKRIEVELKAHTYFYIPKEQSDFYKNPLKDWQTTIAAFPKATYDIEEASKCLSLRRNTGCVFHLMRVIGAGVTALGKSLNEPTLDASHNLTWDNVLRRCAKELALKFEDMSPDWKKDKQFYAEATAKLYAVKDAWRNPNAHEVGEKYTDEEAEDIYRTVRSFMRHLATKLKE